MTDQELIIRLDNIERAVQILGALATFDAVKLGYGNPVSYVRGLVNDLSELLVEIEAPYIPVEVAVTCAGGGNCVCARSPEAAE